jgi:prenylcysteine oxidase/farnesylcysteine lyase
MHKAVRVFNLTLVEHDSEGGGMAIWDGTSFVFEQVSGSYWDLFKMFWRYGPSSNSHFDNRN